MIKCPQYEADIRIRIPPYNDIKFCCKHGSSYGFGIPEAKIEIRTTQSVG